jgi:hypothetical protein
MTHLVDFDASIFANNPRPATWRIKQHTVKATHDLGKLASVIGTYYDIFAPEPVNIGC